MKIHDTIVLGAGPAGLTAALYCARSGLDTLILEKLSWGGQMALTAQIDNYPGFEQGIDGMLLSEKMRQSAQRFGAVLKSAAVLQVHLESDVKTVATDSETLRARTLIIATGASPRKLNVPNEDRLTGRGLSYCATCDGMFFKDRTVAVIGGGNSAAEDALILSRICAKVMIVHRRDALRADKIYRDRLSEAKNIDFCWNVTVQDLLGAERLTGLRLREIPSGSERDLACDGAFVAIGRIPETELFRGQLPLNADGSISADETTRTGIPGVFAAGDVRAKPVRQIVTAVSDGAVAAHAVLETLNETTTAARQTAAAVR